MEKEIFEPSPSRLIESLRDTGYSFVTAVADIVDNSITAEATTIHINLFSEFDGNLKFQIADNGTGMNQEELKQAMRYGSPEKDDPQSLGKFGIGLKTASTSFCRKLTVISQKNGEINARQWDLDLIEKSNAWELITPQMNSDDIEFLKSISCDDSGTIVIWENIDRLIKNHNKIPGSVQIESLVNDLKLHLSGVFGRFLDHDYVDAPNIEIFINEEKIEAWDPFCSWLDNVEKDENPYEIKEEGNVVGKFQLNAYILPNKNSLTKEEQEKARYGLENQGFYIYRENRLIYSGGWLSRLFIKESHMNLLRVEISFDYKLDDIFQIDIKKSRIILPHALRSEMKKLLTPVRREAQRKYRGFENDSLNLKDDETIHENSNKILSKHMDTTVSSKFSNIDKKNQKAKLNNRYGSVEISIPVDEDRDIIIDARDSLQDGVLWTYAIMNNNHAVLLNRSHEFYKRFYYNTETNSTLRQSMDLLFWSLAESELSTVSDKAKRNLEEMRFMVSRILRELAIELPEYIEENEEEDE